MKVSPLQLYRAFALSAGKLLSLLECILTLLPSAESRFVHRFSLPTCLVSGYCSLADFPFKECRLKAYGGKSLHLEKFVLSILLYQHRSLQ